jgi:hypothetical protein
VNVPFTLSVPLVLMHGGLFLPPLLVIEHMFYYRVGSKRSPGGKSTEEGPCLSPVS